MLWALVLILPSALFAGPSSSILVVGNSCRTENGTVIFMGSVSLVCKDPAETIKVSANEITFDQISGRQGGISLLRCSGETVIESGGRTIKGKDITFEFADMKGNIYVLNSNGIVIGSTDQKSGPSDSWPQSPASKPLPTFDAVPSTKVETQLQRIPTVFPVGPYAPGFTPHP